MVKKVASAVSWSAIDVFMRNGFGILVIIFLARILSPADFGLYAMLGIFTSIAYLFIDGGFAQALIQRQDVTHTDESSVFFFNLMMGFLIALIFCASAPWIADFYNQPILRNIIFAMAFNLFISAFSSVQTALLMKKLEFKIIAKIGICSSVIAGIIAVLAAWQGFGVWYCRQSLDLC